MLPRWFRAVLVVDLALVVAVAVLGTRLAVAGARATAPLIRWDRPPSPPGPAAGRAATPLAPPPPAPPAAGSRPPQARLDASLLRRLDADAASTAATQQGLLGGLEEMIRRRIAALLDHAGRGGRGG